MGYQKLIEPKLIELDSGPGFIIATEINLDYVVLGTISFRGKSYDYTDENLQEDGDKEIQFSVKREAHFNLDAIGQIID